MSSHKRRRVEQVAPEDPIGFCSACSTPLYASTGGRCERCGHAPATSTGTPAPTYRAPLPRPELTSVDTGRRYTFTRGDLPASVDEIEDRYARGEIDVDELERELTPAIERESRGRPG